MIARDDGVTPWPAIGGEQAIGGGKRFFQARPAMHLRVVGQAAVGQGHGGGQLGVGAVGTMRPQQRMVLRQGLAVDKGLGDGAALGQFGLDPVRVDVARP